MCFILSFVTKTTLISIKRFHCLFGKQTPSELILKSPHNGCDLSNTNKYNVYVRAQIFFWLKNFQTSLNLLFISNRLPGSLMKKKNRRSTAWEFLNHEGEIWTASYTGHPSLSRQSTLKLNGAIFLRVWCSENAFVEFLRQYS